MQKFLWKASFAAVAVTTLLSPLASSASALTQAQVSAIINLLQSFGAYASVVANVQASLTGNSGNHYGQWCHVFNTNLSAGYSGAEADALTEALKREGSPSVIAFQEKYKDEILTPNGLTHGTGYVGAATRKKLNQLYGCGGRISPMSSIKIISPNGGEILSPGTLQTLKWTFNDISNPASQWVVASLVRDGDENFLTGVGFNPAILVAQIDPNLYISPDTPRGKYRFKLALGNNRSIYDVSDAPFILQSTGSEAVGALDITISNTRVSIVAGATKKRLATVTLYAGSGESLKISEIGFHVEGSGNGAVPETDIKNLELVSSDGNKVGSVASAISINPSGQPPNIIIPVQMELSPGQAVTLNLMGDISRDNFEVFLPFSSYFKVIGAKTGGAIFKGINTTFKMPPSNNTLNETHG
ncbi:MAG: hypothetical protein AAB482_03730 [Patescibacteria group bacterium]